MNDLRQDIVKAAEEQEDKVLKKKSFPKQLMDDLQRWFNPTDKKVAKALKDAGVD